MNKAILVGRLGKDPEFKRLGDKQTPMAKFSIATKGRGESEWHNIVVWGKSAEICEKYLSKGSQVGIDGEIKTRSWEQDGQKKYTTEIHTYNISLMGKSEPKDTEINIDFGMEKKNENEMPF